MRLQIRRLFKLEFFHPGLDIQPLVLTGINDLLAAAHRFEHISPPMAVYPAANADFSHLVESVNEIRNWLNTMKISR